LDFVEADFKAFFRRDFPYGDTDDTVTDEDIDNAFTEANTQFNEALFDTDDQKKVAYMNLSAHLLVQTIRAGQQGIASGYSWLQAAKAVGPVSESFSIPQRILDNPQLAMLTETRYGAKYLQLLLPQLAGQVFAVRGCE